MNSQAHIGTLATLGHHLWAYWTAGGWLMVPLALSAVLIWFRYFMLLRQLRESLHAPADCTEETMRRVVAGEAPEATRGALARMPGLLPRLLADVLARTATGVAMPDAFLQARESALSFYSRAFYWLGALVVAAPLLGLLGTVLGMMETFRAVAGEAGHAQAVLGGGLSKALITTQIGLVVALPGTFGLAHLFRLYQHLRHAVDRAESALLQACHRLESKS